MRISILFAAALVLGLGPRAARAGDPLEPAAKARFDAGVKLTNAGQYDDAIREFLAAYEIDPDPVLFYSLAVAERLAGRCPAAIDYYRQFLGSNPNAQRTEAARSGIVLCEAQRAGAETAPPRLPCPVAAPREAARPWYTSPLAGAVVAGVVGAGLGTGFLVAASSTRDRAATAAFSDDFEAELDRATGQRRIGATFLVLGAALAGGGVAYHYAVQRKRRPGVGAIGIGIAGRSLFVARSF